MTQSSADALLDLAAGIVSSYVGNHEVAAGDLPTLIQSVYGAIKAVDSGQSTAPAEPLAPAVPIKKSITPDYLICLEDGRKFKSLKRHLRTSYNLTPEQYRAKWSLPIDYPMVAPAYGAARSALAKQIGLGRGVRKADDSATRRKRAKAG